MTLFASILLSSALAAGPSRTVPTRPTEVKWEEGSEREILIIKLSESLSGKLAGSGVEVLLRGAEPLFSAEVLRQAALTHAVHPELADLSLYFRLVHPDAAKVGTALLTDPRVETAYLEMAPVPPPLDLRPLTPDFRSEQVYLDAAPDGMSIDEARSWPGGRGENIRVIDIEYGWEPWHEDLDGTRDIGVWGWNSGYYAFHGTSVLGILVGGENGYGVEGIAPLATPSVVSPYDDEQVYNVAEAVLQSGLLLEAGDVLLIEQQAFVNGDYCPVEAYSAIFDAITHVVAQGVHVIEPSGNGGQNLDDDDWEGWFDRSVRDSGAIMIGGAAVPGGGFTPRAWFPGGSSYGERVDLQGWFAGIVTTTNGELGGSTADLFLPLDDGRQGYTLSFGGTSGAAAQVAGLVALANSIAVETWGEPWEPMALRAALVQSGTPQEDESLAHIGPQPDLRRLLRAWAAR